MGKSKYKLKIGQEVANTAPDPTQNDHVVNLQFFNANMGNESVVTISVSRNFQDSDHNKILMVTSNVTLTMPSTGIRNNFHTDIDVLSTGQVSIIKDTGVTFDFPFGQILEANKMGTIYRKGTANEYRGKGEFSI